MEIIPPYLRIYQQILKDLENALPFLNVPKAKAGRKPKLTDIHIAAIFILSYITNTKVLTLAQLLIDPYIQSWHIFRRYRLKRVYRILREYKLHKLRLMILARLLYGYVGEYKDGCYVCVCEFRLSACFWFWHIKEWKGIFKVFEDLLVDA